MCFFHVFFPDFLMVPASRLQIAIPLICQGPTAKVIALEGSKPVSPRTDDKGCAHEQLQPLFRAGPMTKTIHSNSFNPCFTPDRTQTETSKSRQPLFRAGPILQTIPSNTFNPCFTSDRTQKDTSKSCQPLFHVGPSTRRHIETAPTSVLRRTDDKNDAFEQLQPIVRLQFL